MLTTFFPKQNFVSKTWSSTGAFLPNQFREKLGDNRECQWDHSIQAECHSEVRSQLRASFTRMMLELARSRELRTGILLKIGLSAVPFTWWPLGDLLFLFISMQEVVSSYSIHISADALYHPIWMCQQSALRSSMSLTLIYKCFSTCWWRIRHWLLQRY